MLVNQPYNNTAGLAGRTQSGGVEKTSPANMKMTGESVMPYSRTTPNIASVPNMSSMPNMSTSPMTGVSPMGTGMPPMPNMGVSPMTNAGTAPMPNMDVAPMSKAGVSPISNMDVAPMPNMGVSPISKSGVSPAAKPGAAMTGLAGVSAAPGMPAMTASTAAMETPTTVESPYYTAGFMRNFLGKNMRVEFLIGTTGPLVDRIGVLVEVGASYIVLRPYLTDNLLMCDLYSIKFVTIYG